MHQEEAFQTAGQLREDGQCERRGANQRHAAALAQDQADPPSCVPSALKIIKLKIFLAVWK